MPSSGIPKFKIPNIDKIAHFGFFFVQSILVSLILYLQTKFNYMPIVLISTLLSFVYGGSIELLQQAYFNRTCDVLDLIADVTGGFTGAAIYPLAVKLLKIRSKNYI
jgi:VanZ family protein